MDWLKVESSGEGNIKVPSNWLLLHYYEALSILFRVENALRSLVYIVLKNNKGIEWAEMSLSSDDASQTTIAALAKKRISQSQNYGYLGYQVSSPLMHLTSGELVRLLTSEPNWPLFKNYFKASKQVVSLKLEEIGTIRNSLAHFRPLTQNDVEVVKQNANQVFSVIEETLANIVTEGQRVPTNLNEEWYLNLRSLGGQQSQIIHTQSIDGQWIRLSLQFNCPIISKFPIKPEKFATYTILNVNPVGMLIKFNLIRQFVTCVMESIPNILMPADFNPSIMKHLDFIFLKDILKSHHNELKNDLEELIAEVDSEADLIREDNLARGKVVYICNIKANIREASGFRYWYFDRDDLHQPLGEKDPPEFWGSLEMYTNNFVSDAHRFPWMPVLVSDIRFPW